MHDVKFAMINVRYHSNFYTVLFTVVLFSLSSCHEKVIVISVTASNLLSSRRHGV